MVPVSCIMMHFAPHALHILILSHTYAFARSRFRGAGAGDPKGSMVVHKRQVTRKTNIVGIKASLGASHYNP
jgi:uncharacterized membrane protein YdbT with pleckstrin-like domain